MQRVAAVLAFLYGGERIRPRPSQLLRFGDGGAGAFGGGWRSDSDDRSGRAHTLHDVAGNVTTRTYMIPADAPATTGSPGDVPGRLEGGVARPAVGDPRGICALTVRAALTGAKHNASSRLRVRSGHRIRVEGTLSRPSPGSQTITVSLVNASHLRSSHTWRIATRSDGAYTVLLRPRVSGRIIAAFSGSTNFRSTRAGARELIRVVPIIQALFTAHRTTSGFVNPTVHGRVLPNPEAGITLAWQARISGGRWQPIGPLAATVRPKSDGTFVRQLHLVRSIPHVQLRLIYLGTAGGPYATAASEPQFLRWSHPVQDMAAGINRVSGAGRVACED